MSKVKSFVYYIEYNDGNEEIMEKVELESEIDNNFDKFFNKILKIVKQYRLYDEPKKKINMTLFTTHHTFSPEEYIGHYRSLSKEVYGSNFLSDFDIDLITMFN